MEHRRDLLVAQQQVTQLLVRAKEHPRLHGDKRTRTTSGSQVSAAFDEGSEQVGLAVRVLALHEL